MNAPFEYIIGRGRDGLIQVMEAEKGAVLPATYRLVQVAWFAEPLHGVKVRLLEPQGGGDLHVADADVVVGKQPERFGR